MYDHTALSLHIFPILFNVYSLLSLLCVRVNLVVISRTDMKARQSNAMVMFPLHPLVGPFCFIHVYTTLPSVYPLLSLLCVQVSHVVISKTDRKDTEKGAVNILLHLVQPFCLLSSRLHSCPVLCVQVNLVLISKTDRKRKTQRKMILYYLHFLVDHPAYSLHIYTTLPSVASLLPLVCVTVGLAASS